MNNIVLHIGLHKTGTTFLQENIFPESSSLHIVRGMHSIRWLFDDASKRTVLISDENISGSFMNEGYLQSFKKNIDFISKVFIKPKVIIGFREHSSFILSLYKQYLHQAGDKDFDDFFSFNSLSIINKEDLFFKERLQLISQISEQFFVYTLESMIEREDNFLIALSDFLEIEKIKKNNNSAKNVGIDTVLQVNTLRRINKINKVLDKKLSINLYSKVFKRLKITPRHLCQSYMPKLNSNKFKLSDAITSELKYTFKHDWEFIKNNISY